MKRIIVLGGGYGGVLTAKKLAKNLKRQRDVHITLIDRNPYHTLLTELHEVAGNRIDEGSIKVDLNKIFKGFSNVTITLDDITHIDFTARKLTGGQTVYHYDYLVIGTGSKPTFFGTPGADEFAFSLWSYEDAVNLREHVLKMFRLAVKERDMKKRRDMLTFVVVGAGFTGVEMIGELAEFTEELCKSFYIDPAEVKLYIVDMADKILPVLPNKLIKKAEKRLHKLNVNIITNKKITAVTESAVHLNGQTIDSNTVIWTAGVEGSDLVAKMDVEQEGRRRVVTNEKLQIPEHQEVYVVGDNIYFIPEGETAPVPQMVENAELAAPLIAHNITADILDKPKKGYKPTFHGMMVCIGSRFGVAYVGIPKLMMPLSGFLAMFVKHMINMIYLFQICGFNEVFAYMQQEFFNVKHNRSFVGGHLAKRSPNFWLLPLRLFVGWMLASQGWEKLIALIGDPNYMFLVPAQVADGTTGMFYTATGDFTAFAYAFQASIVIAALLFGILLSIGLFTTPSAIATIVMSAIVWGMGIVAPTDILWYLAGGIALVSGSGSTFGLDYYVLPKLKAVWKELPLVKRWYLYVD